MKSHERKRRTRQHTIADLSVNHVERHALLAGYVIERTAHDYGIDLEITTFNKKGEIEEGKILAQLKATDKLMTRGRTTFAWRIDRADLVLWMAHPFPVMLIVYDATREVAYWVYVQSYFTKQKDLNLFAVGKTITVRVPLTNVVDSLAIQRFARFRDRILEQMDEVQHDEDEGDPVR